MTTLAVADDRTLSDRLARGDRGALSTLYERYAGLVFGVALRVVKDRSLAEELVQETFLEAWRCATRYEPKRATPAAWLITIARSRAIDRSRTRAVQQKVYQATEVPEPVEPPDAVVDLARQRALVAGVVASLPAAQRDLLELAWSDGLSQREIAETTGIPLGTVKTRTRAALLEVANVVRSAMKAEHAAPG